MIQKIKKLSQVRTKKSGRLNLLQSIIKRRLWVLASNPLFVKLWRKCFAHDYFYYKLLRKKIVQYDQLNKTYIRDIKGVRFHLDPSDIGISRVLARDGIREKESVDALYKYVHPDMTIFDLGANIGFYVVLEAQIISKGAGKIVALEPAPKNVNLLRLNVETNNYGDCVEIYNGAVCKRSGTVQLELSPAFNSHRLATLFTEGTNLDRINVPAFTFSDFLRHTGISIEQLDFLRMDIEGAEYEIFPEIIGLLKKKKSFLMFIEFHPYVDEPSHIEILKKLELMGFKCLTATKEYIDGEKGMRVHCPDATIKQLYTEKFFLQFGGCEAFLRKG